MTINGLNKRHVAAGATILLVLAGVGWLAGGGGDQAEPASEAAADPGALTDAQIRQLGIRLEPAQAAGAALVGTQPGVVWLPPEARVARTSPFAGTVLRVMVIQGQRVRAGEPLAVVRTAETVQFGADLARAEADLAVERAAAARLETLAREGVVAGSRADEARAALYRTEATIRENRRLLALGGATGDGTATLRAPIAGRVAIAAIEAGATTGGGGPAPFVIENDSALTLDLQVPERLAGRILPGMAVEIAGTDPARPTARGRILSVGASLDPATRSIPAKAALDAGSVLTPGKGIMAVVTGDAGTAGGTALSVPSGAVTRMDGQDYVFVRSGARFVQRKVIVAAEAAGRTIITDGLRAGEAVATSGVAELKSLLAGQ